MLSAKRLLSACLIPLVAVAASSAAEGTARKFRIPSLYHVGFWIRDAAKSRAFYKTYLGFDEPYDLIYPDGRTQMIVMKVNERQVIYVFPNPARILPDGDNLDHLGLEVDNIDALHDYLLARGLSVKKPNKGKIGDLILGVKDPDGHAFEVTQLMPEGQLMKHQGQDLAATRISNHLVSAAISVADLDASIHFYRDILGFREVWRDRSANPTSVHLQVPDGTDYLDLRPYVKKEGENPPRAVPEYSLEVPDASKAAGILAQRAQAGGFAPPEPVSVGVDGRRRTSCVDPDGTRVVLEEFPESASP